MHLLYQIYGMDLYSTRFMEWICDISFYLKWIDSSNKHEVCFPGCFVFVRLQ